MKQKMLSGLGLAALAVFLVGCDEIEFGGALDIHEQITFAQEGEDPYTCNQKPDWWNCKPGGNVVVNPGQFSTKATLGMSNGQEKQIKLEIKNANPPTVIELNFDKNIETGDHFTITAAQLKQNFDLAGDIITKVTQSPEQSGTEYCTYQVQEMVCRGADTAKSGISAISIETVEADIQKFGPYPGQGGFPYPGHGGFPYPGPNYAGPYPGPYPGTVCHPVWVNRPGSMFVRYYYETTDKDITARFLQGDKKLADYAGHASRSEKKYTYQSMCR